MICVPLAALSLCLAAYNFFSTRAFAIAGAEASMDLLSTHMAAEVNVRLTQIEKVGNALARYMSDNWRLAENEEDLYSLLEYAFSNGEAIYGGSLTFDEYAAFPDKRLYAPYIYLNEQGRFERSHIGYDYTDAGDNRADWFTQPKRANAGGWSLPYYDEGAGNIYMCTYSQLLTPNDRFKGVATVDIGIDWLHRFVADIPGEMAKYGYACIVDGNGTFVAHVNPALVENVENLFEAENMPEPGEARTAWEKFRADIGSGVKGLVRIRSPKMDDNQWVYLGYAPIEATGWYVLTVIIENKFMAPVYRLILVQAVMLIGAAIFFVVAGLFVSGHLVKPLRKAADFALSIGQGRYDKRMEVPRQLESGILVGSLNDMAETLGMREREADRNMDNLRHIFEKIGVVAAELNRVSQEVSEASEVLSAGSEEQSGIFDQLAEAVTTIHGKANSNVEHVERADELLGEMRRDMEQGNADMAEMSSTIDDISRSAEKIGAVMKSIDDIAFQTNLLSLNAAIEAARAGWQGKGFSVVAEEVRRLARRSAASATETGLMLEEAKTNARRGVDVGEKTAAALQSIDETLRTLSKYMHDVKNSSDDQLSTLSDILVGLKQVHSVTATNTERAATNSRAASELRASAESLWNLMIQYKQGTRHIAGGARLPFDGAASESSRP